MRCFPATRFSFCSVRLGNACIQIDPNRFGSVWFGVVMLESIRFDSDCFGPDSSDDSVRISSADSVQFSYVLFDLGRFGSD